MRLDVESLQQQFPPYLTAADKEVLAAELEAISSGMATGYFLGDSRNSYRSRMLQGDGWRGFQTFRFDTKKLQSIRGMVLSNTCDVAPENARALPTWVTFAPLVKLRSYEDLLSEHGISSDRIRTMVDSIKEQRTMNIFYLPAEGPLQEDYIVRFDQVQSMPLSKHNRSPERKKLFTLSASGFYMLTFKLSLHFCRLQENVSRRDDLD